MVRWPSSETPSELSFDCSLERTWPSTDHDSYKTAPMFAWFSITLILCLKKWIKSHKYFCILNYIIFPCDDNINHHFWETGLCPFSRKLVPDLGREVNDVSIKSYNFPNYLPFLVSGKPGYRRKPRETQTFLTFLLMGYIKQLVCLLISFPHNIYSIFMPGTYTHKFDTPAYKGDVTINTGWVPFLYYFWA